MMIKFLIHSDTWGDIVKNLLGIMIDFFIQCDTIWDIVKNLLNMTLVKSDVWIYYETISEYSFEKTVEANALNGQCNAATTIYRIEQ